jgi:hypothetical protein
LPVWEREEIQEMLRSIVSLVILLPLLGGHALGAIWPEQLGPFTRGGVKAVALEAKEVWEEYGLLESEQAEYKGEGKTFTAVASRFKDPTGALAAFQWQRPAGAVPSKVGDLAVETPGALVLAFHNYLLRFEGWKPDGAALVPMLPRLPLLDQGSLPTLPGYIPPASRVANSERYILGPASLAYFEKRIPPSAAAFHMGTEGQFTRYATKAGEISLGVFSYPTPNLARDREAAFAKISGAMVKRSGPLVAIILPPADPDEAERLMAKVQYQATITWSEQMPTARDNVGNLILNIVTLVGFLLLFCLAAGLAFGGFRVISRRYFRGWATDDTMIVLHLEDR